MMATAPATITIQLPLLHPKQRGIFCNATRFRVLMCGRAFGKSTLALAACIEAAAEPGAEAWYLGPSYPEVDQQWREFRAMLPPEFPGRFHEQGKRLDLDNGASISFKSAHVGEGSLRGGQRRLVVVDEAGSIGDLQAIWEKALRPALTRHGGRALFVGTPRGHGYFTRLYSRGLGGDPEWRSWRYLSADNPHLPAADIEAARASLPEAVFQQEYLAAIIADGGAVIRRIDEATRGHLPAEPYDGRFAIGVDWAKRDDFTALTVVDCESGEVVEIDRFNQIDYALQTQRLKALSDRWQPQVVLVEQNSIGEPLLEQLVRDGLPVRGFMTTAQSKPPLIEDLSLAFERGEIGIPADANLRHELQAFTVTMSTNGRPSYAGGKGCHDDTVMSLALAWRARTMASQTWEVW